MNRSALFPQYGNNSVRHKPARYQKERTLWHLTLKLKKYAARTTHFTAHILLSLMATLLSGGSDCLSE